MERETKEKAQNTQMIQSHRDRHGKERKINCGVKAGAVLLFSFTPQIMVGMFFRFTGYFFLL